MDRNACSFSWGSLIVCLRPPLEVQFHPIIAPARRKRQTYWLFCTLAGSNAHATTMTRKTTSAKPNIVCLLELLDRVARPHPDTGRY
jgi:hypothetical protein